MGVVFGLSLGARGPLGVATRLLMMGPTVMGLGVEDDDKSEWGREDAKRYPTKVCER